MSGTKAYANTHGNSACDDICTQSSQVRAHFLLSQISFSVWRSTIEKDANCIHDLYSLV